MVSETNVLTRCDTTGGQELRRIPIAGGASTSVHSSALFQVGNGPAGDASFAYFAELDQAGATKILVKKVANTGGSPTTVGEVAGGGHRVLLAVDSTKRVRDTAPSQQYGPRVLQDPGRRRRSDCAGEPGANPQGCAMKK